MPTSEYIACIDVGTTGCRTIFFDRKGRPVSRAYEEYSSIFISPTWIDHDPSTWIHAVKNTLGRALGQLPERSRSIAAVAVISQRATFVPMDSKGRPLDHAILWQDKRAIEETEIVRNTLGEEAVYQKTGLRIDPYFTLPKLLWLKKNKPDVFGRIHRILSVHDFVVHWLTGVWIMDWTQASRTMLFDIRKFEWDAELCECFEIPPDILPETVAPGTVVGTLQPSIAKEYGLSPDIPVVAVGGDQQAAAVGLGIVEPGRMCVNIGTGSFILAHADHPTFDKERRVVCTASAVAGKWLMEAGIFTTGSVYRWFRDQFAGEEKHIAEKTNRDVYQILDDEAGQVPAGSEGILLIPHFAGSAAPYWDPNASGLFFGLTLGHKRAHIIRAILEGLCMEMNKNIQILENLTRRVSEIRVSGGATRSDVFNQIQADVYGKAVLKGVSEQASALGAVIVASVGIGLYPDIPAAVRSLVDWDERNRKTPDAQTHALYEKMMILHDALYKALHETGIYAKANALREPLKIPT